MRSALQDLCESGVDLPACQPQNWFFMNSYELGLNNEMEVLPQGLYDPNQNPYVRNIVRLPIAQNSLLLNTNQKQDIQTLVNNNNDQMQSFSISNFISENPGIALVIAGIGLYLVSKAVK